MLLRRATPLALALACLACEPAVPFDLANNPAKVDYAGFDLTSSPPSIPLPNDLALLPQAIATQSPAQQALLTQWAQDVCVGGLQGCFPNDQEVPVTLDFVTQTIDPGTGAVTRSMPQLDLSSISPSNLLVLSISTLGSGPVPYDPPQPADYVQNGDHGTLTLHRSPNPNNGGSRRWPANSAIVVAVRGGAANGVKVINGEPHGLQPQPAMYLLLQDKDLTLAQNQALIPGATRSAKAAAGAQLEQIRKGYLLPFAAIDQAWGPLAHREIATLGTFKVADTSGRTHVETDPSAGRLPLPSDFLTGPDGHLLPQLASPNGPFGPLGPGLGTLDGFSTTAMVLSQTSTAILADTVAGGVFLYKLTPTTNPPFTRLLEAEEANTAAKKPGYGAEPAAITRAALSGGSCFSHPTEPCLSTAIGLQPAAPTRLKAAPPVFPPPLDDASTYVVLVTDRVRDLNGAPLVRSTLGKLLFLDPSISIASGGKSTVSGVGDAQAVGLDQMRRAINGAAQVLLAEKPSLSYRNLVMGYTFKTQSITATASLLAALPYANPTAVLSPPAGTTPTVYCAGTAACAPGPTCPCTTAAAVTDAFNAYGTDPAVAPTGNIGYVIDTRMTTFNKLLCNAGDTQCRDTGAFSPPTVNPVLEDIPVLIALPQPVVGYPGNCNPSTSAIGVCTLPLIVFRHGFSGGRADMLAVADSFTAQGFAVAAIDSSKHGDRALCDPGAPITVPQCAGGGVCTPDPALAGEGDPATRTPGHCANGAFFRRPPPIGCATCTQAKAIPVASGNYFISANFFRTRDSQRQDIIDQSQLVRVLSPNPGCDITKPPTDPSTCANKMITAFTGVQIDPARIYYVGISMGAIAGTVNVAANPRFSRAAYSVGGSTLVDVFTNSPAFAPSVNALLAAIGISQGTPAYLQFVNVVKWVLDPADAENFAQHLTANTLPSPLLGGAAPPPKKVIGQMALCDNVVPNPFNVNLYTQIGLGPVDATHSSFTVFFKGATATPGCPANAAPHGFLVDWTNSATLAAAGQSDITGFFADPSVLPLPAHFQ